MLFEVKKILAVVCHVEQLQQFEHIFVFDGVYTRKVCREHVYLRRLFHRFDKPEGFVEACAGSVYAVHRHISEAITTENVAKALFISRSRLSVKFKQETGEKLVDFILKEKVTEAKRLLRYTDKPVSAISAYLGFSSQSHLTHVFKKYAGCLPNEYRKRHER